MGEGRHTPLVDCKKESTADHCCWRQPQTAEASTFSHRHFPKEKSQRENAQVEALLSMRTSEPSFQKACPDVVALQVPTSVLREEVMSSYSPNQPHRFGRLCLRDDETEVQRGKQQNERHKISLRAEMRAQVL